MVDLLQADGPAGGVRIPTGFQGFEAGGKDAGVLVTIDKGVSGVAVGFNGGRFVDALVRLDLFGSADSRCSTADGLVVGKVDVVDKNGNVGDTVAVLTETVCFGMVGTNGRSEDKGDVALANDVGCLVLGSRFEARVCRSVRESDSVQFGDF
jgi:hypothetical protein